MINILSFKFIRYGDFEIFGAPLWNRTTKVAIPNYEIKFLIHFLRKLRYLMGYEKQFGKK